MKLCHPAPSETDAAATPREVPSPALHRLYCRYTSAPPLVNIHPDQLPEPHSTATGDGNSQLLPSQNPLFFYTKNRAKTSPSFTVQTSPPHRTSRSKRLPPARKRTPDTHRPPQAVATPHAQLDGISCHATMVSQPSVTRGP